MTQNKTGGLSEAIPKLGQLFHVMRTGLRHPPSLLTALHRAGGMLLDVEFARRSAIPEMPTELLGIVQRNEVVLPPLNLMQPGNQSYSGLAFLASLARSLDAKRCFEIGTYNGLTAWCLARNLQGAVVDTLDLPPNEDAALPLGPLDNLNRVHFATPIYELLSRCSEVRQHWGDSALFDFSQFHGLCDLVYIDGAHSREYVESDTENALEMVSVGGAVVWDDYWRNVPEVSSVLDVRAELNLYRVPGTRLVVYLTDGGENLCPS
jgi:predicted O-methyltransferase YrrM